MCKIYFEKSFCELSSAPVATGDKKTTINIRADVYDAAEKLAKALKIDFSELVEVALERDIGKRMALVTSEGKSHLIEIEGEGGLLPKGFTPAKSSTTATGAKEKKASG